MKKIKTNDEVVVTAGKDRGKRGKVTKILSDGRYLVSGVNVSKRHTKPNPAVGKPGGIIEKENPIQSSNVAIFNPASKKADRVGIRLLEDGTKVRFFKSNDEVIDV
jgi:large subunit ribosomal protein L24